MLRGGHPFNKPSNEVAKDVEPGNIRCSKRRMKPLRGGCCQEEGFISSRSLFPAKNGHISQDTDASV